MALRRLNDEQRQEKQVLMALAQEAFKDNSALLNEYADEENWRLARVDEDICNNGAPAFQRGDVTLARRDSRPSAVPKLFAFSWRKRKHMVLQSTDPIEFLED